MDKSIIQALTGLVPTISPLPSELIELAVSLLAHSRNKASSLKVEEEIARSYVCAHLACERFVTCIAWKIGPLMTFRVNRLKLNLGLPKLQPRPPCPPRIYQKLYKYLDSALSAGARRSARPPRPVTDALPPTSSPVKTRTPVKSTLFKASTPGSRRTQEEHTFASEIPKWVMPLIRRLCKAFDAPAAPPHVFAGVSSILTLPPPHRADPGNEKVPREDVNISALVIMVYLLVSTRLTGAHIPPEEFVRQRTLAVETIRDSGIEQALKEVSEESDVVAQIMGWGREISSNGWAELDWFENVPEGTGLGLGGGMQQAEEGSEGDDENLLPSTSIVKHLEFDEGEDPNILRPGLGTMVSNVDAF